MNKSQFYYQFYSQQQIPKLREDVKMLTNKIRTDLEPCPFCGGTQVEVSHGENLWECVCLTCFAVGPFANSRQEAIEEWQGRVKR